MRFWRLPVVAIAACTVSFSVMAQTADEIINKHIEAIGGKDKINAMKSLYTEADLEIQGNAGTSTSSVIFGKGSYTEIELAGQKIVNSISADKGAWTINPFAGQATAESMPESQANAMKAQLFPGGPLFDYAARGNKVELAGQEEANGKKAWKFNVTSKEGTKMVIYVDPTSYFITRTVVKINANGQDVEQGVNLSDYKKTEYGYYAPYSSAIEIPGGMVINLTVRKVEVNKEIDPKIFDKP